jgi:class 3 adenylate cyclase/tetratricopeptide (TPR) repeat protein
MGEGDRFCGDCGAAAGVCPSCGEPLTPGKRFCRACGSPIAGNPPAIPAAAATVKTGPEPVAERRVCSVLFCDVVGFTPLSESRDPEAVRELLTHYFAVARTVIGRYGGVVEKFIGDAVMAVWGTPAATEGDAERAVRAALDLVAAVAALGAEAAVPGLTARVGVVTGEVAVSLGAAHEGMVAGDAVNTAARVQSVAAPGQVLVDAATHRLTGGAVGFTPAGSHQLKGKAEPQELWRATRVLSWVGASQRMDGLEAPLTGRDAELRTIKDMFHATADRRMPRLVLVSGPAGVGKSRLGWEFEKYADGLMAEMWWHRGRCLSYGEGVAFWALAEVVRQRLGIAEEDPAEVAATKLKDGLDRFVLDPGERAYSGVRLSRLLGVAFPADSGVSLSRDELFAGWRLFFERLAAVQPLVLLVEDAQYADTGLLDFLDHLIDWTRDLPVYVLVFARPELDQVRSGFGTGRNRSTLSLDPLDIKSMDQLVDALVPGMPPAARSKITSQAQGIPLFAVETVRSLIDRDIVRPVEGVYRLTGDVGELVVPDSLHALLAARLDALDPGVRRLVSDAAVLGTSFPAEALIAVSGRDEPSVRAALAELVHREVLSVSADPLSPERGSYRFSQGMLRQVAYDILSRRDRKTRHLTVAAHLRAAFASDGEEVTEVIARHYLDALNALPDDPDAPEIRDQAVTALIRAAERATRTGAPGQAAASYAGAAELTAHGPADAEDAAGGWPDAGSLWERAAESASASGDWATSVEYAGHARDQYLSRGQVRAAARARATAGQALHWWGRMAEARDQLTAAAEVLRADPDTDTVRVLQNLARLEVLAGLPDADRLTTEAMSLGQSLDVGPGLLSAIFEARGIYHGLAGRRPQAAAYIREGVRLATLADDNVGLGRALLNLSDVLATTDPAAGAEAARSAVGHLRRAGERDRMAFAIGNLIQALLMLGDWDAAEQELTQAADSDGLQDYPFLSCYRGLLAALRGDAATAQTMLAGLGDLRISEDPQIKSLIALVEASTAAVHGHLQDALRHARGTLAHIDVLGISAEDQRWAWPLAVRAAYELRDITTVHELLSLLDSYQAGDIAPMLRAERDLARARLAVADGDQPAAASFAAAITSLRERGTPYHLAHGLLDYAEYLIRQDTADTAAPAIGETRDGEASTSTQATGEARDGEASAAARAVVEARDIGRRLRCPPLLDRADAVQPARPDTATAQML